MIVKTILAHECPTAHLTLEVFHPRMRDLVAFQGGIVGKLLAASVTFEGRLQRMGMGVSLELGVTIIRSITHGTTESPVTMVTFLVFHQVGP